MRFNISHIFAVMTAVCMSLSLEAPFVIGWHQGGVFVLLLKSGCSYAVITWGP